VTDLRSPTSAPRPFAVLAALSAALCAIVVLCASLFAPLTPTARADDGPGPSPLVIAGGGPTVPEVTARALALAGGTATARVLIVPQASEAKDAGAASIAFWREAGARHVTSLDTSDHAAALVAIRAASLIWMSGGDQTRLLRALEGAGLVEAIRERHRAGAVVGGTSAGAAALPAVMLTGDADLESLTAGRTVTATGLGLVPEAIVDQHLLARRRLPRLLAAVLDHPHLVGVGVDEATAAIVIGRRLEVVGRGQVVVVDARGATVTAAQRGAPLVAKDVRIHLLTSGMELDLGEPGASRSGSR